MVGAVAVAVSLAVMTGVTLAQQKPATANSARSAADWTVPRMGDGRPDLQGVWANNNGTPLERPKHWAGRQFISFYLRWRTRALS